MRGKKGDEKIFSLYWFLMFGIIAIVVVSGVILFFSRPLDVRGVEGIILRDRVIDCFVENGALKEDFFSGASADNFESLCRLRFDDKSDEAYDGQMQYYIEIESKGKILKFGREEIEPSCGEEDMTNIPHCISDKLMVLDQNNNLVLVSIKVVIDKMEQNVE